VTAIDTYDEYGVPSATNQGTFQYAGAMWLSGAGLYLNGLRDYGAHLGRFNQTDPMGFGGGMNPYVYVGGDPVNRIDPLGLAQGAWQGMDLPDWNSRDCTGTRLCAWGTSSFLVETAGPASRPGQRPGGAVGATQGSGDIPSAGDIVVSGIALASYDPGQSFVSTTGTIQTGQDLCSEAGCISRQRVNTIIVRGYRKGSLGGVAIDFTLTGAQEQLWVIYPSGSIIFVPTQARFVNNEARNIGHAPQGGYIATLHTHPFEIGGPGSEDFGKPLPVYFMSQGGVYVVWPGFNVATFIGR
jgi:RHS repeat-associated protein